MLNIIVGGACRTLTRNNLLFYLSEEFYTTEQRILNFSICLFPTFGKIKIVGSYEDKITATFQTSAFVCFSFILFQKQCFYLKFHLENFLKPNQFWFQKRDGKYRLTSEGNAMQNAQNDETIISTIYMKTDFPIIKKIFRKL